MERTGRLVDTGPAPGPFTAALDEAIARARASGSVPDTLHFYSRRPPAVTIGYSLDAAQEVNLDYCRARGIDVVRRLSGGGAIYTDERQLVYSLTTRNLLPSSVEASLRVVCTALAEGISTLGVRAEFSPVNDVIVNGRKVSGSAQMRKWGVVLTHGTIIVDADPAEMFRALRVPREKLERHSLCAPESRVTSLRAELGRAPPMEEVKAALRDALERALGVRFAPGRATPAEVELAAELVRTRYGRPEWNIGLRQRSGEGMEGIESRSRGSECSVTPSCSMEGPKANPELMGETEEGEDGNRHEGRDGGRRGG
ncbi:MAG: biotin/lipoate A/B protein ligase family protein [Thermoplasmata archaeon]